MRHYHICWKSAPWSACSFCWRFRPAILARQHLTAIQMLTIAAGYALYFPLILYLSTRFSFAVALVIAVVVPGALLSELCALLAGGKNWASRRRCVPRALPGVSHLGRVCGMEPRNDVALSGRGDALGADQFAESGAPNVKPPRRWF